MKVRNSFVSNSSSSSFIVPTITQTFDRKVGVRTRTTYLSEKQLKSLHDFGFKFTTRPYPTTEKERPILESLKDLRQYSDVWCYGEVVCNQDEVIEFLVKNRIPFCASIHYGHETWVWRPNEDVIHIFANVGVEVEMHGIDMFLDDHKEDKREVHRTVSIADYGGKIKTKAQKDREFSKSLRAINKKIKKQVVMLDRK